MILADPAAADQANAKRAGSHVLSVVAPDTGAIPSPVRLYVVPHAAQVPTPLSERRSPHWHIQPMRRAGTPAISAFGSTSFVITAPAPTNAYSPSVTPQTIVAFAPIEV